MRSLRGAVGELCPHFSSPNTMPSIVSNPPSTTFLKKKRNGFRGNYGNPSVSTEGTGDLPSIPFPLFNTVVLSTYKKTPFQAPFYYKLPLIFFVSSCSAMFATFWGNNHCSYVSLFILQNSLFNKHLQMLLFFLRPDEAFQTVGAFYKNVLVFGTGCSF